MFEVRQGWRVWAHERGYRIQRKRELVHWAAEYLEGYRRTGSLEGVGVTAGRNFRSFRLELENTLRSTEKIWSTTFVTNSPHAT
jgi:hypothetical protein